MDAPHRARSGHQGTAMALAPLAHVLWTRILRYDAADPTWPDRDRFILSAGHASILLYSMLHLTGYGLTLRDLEDFRQWGSRTPGHPEHGHTAGVEVTTGPLGQGIGNAVGMAIAERSLRARFGAEVVDHHVYCVAGDGDLSEGLSHEAASLAGHLDELDPGRQRDLEDLAVDRLLRREVVEEAGLADAHAGRDVVQRRAVEALLSEATPRLDEDGVAGGDRRLRSGHGPRVPL